MPQSTADGLGGDPVVAGEHDDLDPSRAQRLRAPGGVLDRVGDGEDRRRPVVDADEDRGGTVGRSRRPRAPRLAVSSPARRGTSRCRRTRCALDVPGDALADGRVEVGDVGIGRPGAVAASTTAGRGVLGGAFDTAASRSSRRGRTSAPATIAVTDGPALGEVPVLSTTRCRPSPSASSASAFLIRHAEPGAAPDADHDRHRRGEAERTGAGDDQHGDGDDEGVARRGPARPWPRREREDRHGDDRGHEHAATWSAERWIGARERWASATICTIRASIVSRRPCRRA
jgi:hypothetical protein